MLDLVRLGVWKIVDDERKAGFLRRLVPGAAPERLVLFEAGLYDAATFAPAISGCQFVFIVATPFQHDSTSSEVNPIIAL